MKIKNVMLGFVLLAGIPSSGRTFTNKDGRSIEADFISATETEVVVKLKRNLRIHTIKIETLSDEDVAFISEEREKLEAEEKLKAEEAAKKAELKAMSRGARKVVAFVEENKGKKVGNGECWTLADEAYKSSGISRPGSDLRIWGGVVDWQEEDVLPGDILELRATKFKNGQKSAPEHTAVIMKKGAKKGQVVVYHQNWGAPGKIVSELVFDLGEIVTGEAIIYRYGKR